MKWEYIIVLLMVLIIGITFVEGKVYRYGMLSYLGTAVVEISLFVFGVCVGRLTKGVAA